MTGWGAEQLTREELLNLPPKLHRAWDTSAQQANRSHYTAGRAWWHFAAAAEMAELWGEVADELIVRGPGRAAQAPGAEVVRQPEAGL